MRPLLVILANLALPFVLWYLRNAVWRFLLRKKYGKDFDHKTRIPEMHVKKIIKLLSLGVVCLALTLFAMRMFNEPGDFKRLETVTEEYSKF